MFDRVLVRTRAIPSEPPRRRGATSSEQGSDYFSTLATLLAGIPWVQIGLGSVVVLFAALVPWGAGQVLTAMDRQIMSIDLKGTLVGENRTDLERRVNAWVGKSFFATDLADVKYELEQRPWVETAAVQRVWPDRLRIEIREKKPLAYWNDGKLVSRSGAVFTPANRDAAGPLPRLSGPDERVRDVIDMGRAMADTLTAHGLGFAGLTLEQRGAWTLHLANGIEVALGRDQVKQRFERFMTVYEGQLATRADEVKRVDARYTNGVAVQWKPLNVASAKS